MGENLDITNLMLDDNNYESVPEGDYHFKVDSYEMDYATSDKFPENTQVIRVHMSVPAMIEGSREIVTIRKDLPICTKMLWLIRQFFECIGMMPEKGRAKMPELDGMIGKTGIFRLVQQVSAKGNEFNSVDAFYSPSKAPGRCDNDDAWNKKADGFEPVSEEAEVNPFV